MSILENFYRETVVYIAACHVQTLWKTETSWYPVGRGQGDRASVLKEFIVIVQDSM